MEDVNFNRSKIYEKLEMLPEPPGYSGKIDWVVQNQIAGTNGRHYIDRIGKLKDYPIYELPVDNSKNGGLMLDIGCGWGRWLIAGANKGYLPIGLDLRLEFCEASLRVLSDLDKSGYVVVGDLEKLPFIDGVFDLVWSFSVIQHTHKIRLLNSLKGIGQTLTSNGFAFLEFPNINGIRNRRGAVQRNAPNADNYNNWAVRYYTIDEYIDLLNQHMSNVSVKVHSFLGIGVLKEDLKYVSVKNKIMTLGSLFLTNISGVLPFMQKHADSLYFKAHRKIAITPPKNNLELFYELHNLNPKENLNIVPLLKCPKYGGPLELTLDKKRLLSKEAGIYYPVINGIPIMISSEAVSLT